MASSHFNLFTDLYWLIMVARVNESFYCQYAYLYSVDNFSTLKQEDILGILVFLSTISLIAEIISAE